MPWVFKHEPLTLPEEGSKQGQSAGGATKGRVVADGSKLVPTLEGAEADAMIQEAEKGIVLM